MPLFQTPALTDDDRRVIELCEQQQRTLRPLVAAPRRWRGLLRRVALARAVRGSNTIEGFTVSVDDAFAALDGEAPMDADELAWRAVQGYRDAMTYVLELGRHGETAVSIDTIKALHFMMQQYDLAKWPGRWRADEIFVLDEDADEVVYIGPDARLVPALMAELVEAIEADPDESVMVRAAMAHLNLAMIHPFKDGNGRMARCLQTFLLSREGVLAPEFCSIEEYLGRNISDYYRVLAEVGAGAWNPHRDAGPWLRFCLTAHYRQSLRVERRAGLASRLWLRAEEAVGAAGLPDRSVQPLAYSLGGRILRNSTYRQLVPDISLAVASRDLAELVRAGLLESRGEKRGRRYLPSSAVREVVVRARHAVQHRLPLDADPYQQAAQ